MMLLYGRPFVFGMCELNPEIKRTVSMQVARTVRLFGRIVVAAALVVVLPGMGISRALGQAGVSEVKPGQAQLVWVDTDIGDDIDDAFALGLILRSPELHVLGIDR